MSRARCACGKVRRAAATACQSCLDAADAARKAAEPERRWARDWRARGWLCAFIDGRVYIAMRNEAGSIAGARSIANDGGRWSLEVDPRSNAWSLCLPGDRVIELLRQISRDCYCSAQFPNGCDFCNGTRLPDGAMETA